MSNQYRSVLANTFAGLIGVLVATLCIEHGAVKIGPSALHAAPNEVSIPVKKALPVATPSPLRRVFDGDRQTLVRYAKSMNLTNAISERNVLMSRSLDLQFTMGSGSVVATGSLLLSEHPSWLQILAEPGSSHAFISEQRILAALESDQRFFSSLPLVKNCTLERKITDSFGVDRGQMDCFVRDGYRYDKQELAKVLQRGLSEGWKTATIPVELQRGIISDNITGSGGYFSLLSEGKSRFKTSPLGRKANIHKATKEKIHGVVIPAGADFSFNATLGGPVEVRTGWSMALGIFEGDQLRPTPGGGVCQVSTTVYRAALAAGLPILKQRNHSMFVAYYEAYGVGQDSTIFPGQQDLIFRNDTGSPILIQAEEDGKEVVVRFYGKPDGRKVEMQGPFFAIHGSKRLVKEFGEDLGFLQIGWKRTILQEGISEPTVERFISTYKTLPKEVPWRWIR